MPVHNAARIALDTYLVEREVSHNDPLIVSGANNFPPSRMTIWRIVSRASERAGLHHVHPHTLRHTFASHMLSGGADLRVIQDILGHADVNTTQHYTRVDLDRLKEIHKLHPRQ